MEAHLLDDRIENRGRQDDAVSRYCLGKALSAAQVLESVAWLLRV
jgi:hypothetical protein